MDTLNSHRSLIEKAKAMTPAKKGLMGAILIVLVIGIAAAVWITVGAVTTTPIERYRDLISAPGIVHYKATTPANRVRPLVLEEKGTIPEDNSTQVEFVPSKEPLKERVEEEVWYDPSCPTHTRCEHG